MEVGEEGFDFFDRYDLSCLNLTGFYHHRGHTLSNLLQDLILARNYLSLLKLVLECLSLIL